MPKIIIDTDIGTDVDDAIALAYTVRSGLDIALITTTHGNAHLRAQIAKKVTTLLDVDISIAAGEDYPLQGRQKWLSGIEEKGLNEGESYPVRTDGIEALAQTIYENKGNVTLVSLAPLTTVAKAFQRYPDLPEHLSHFYVMGNALLCKEQYHLNYRAHNFKVDPHAADVVFSTEMPKTIITTEVCKRNALTREEIIAFRASEDIVLRYLADAADRWLACSQYQVAYLYDPLVIHHLLDDSCTEKRHFGKDRVTTRIRENLEGETFKNKLLKTLQRV